MSFKSGELVGLVPWVRRSLATDRVAPIGLGGDPLPVHPALVHEETKVDQLGHPGEIRVVRAATDQSHESRRVVQVPDSSPVPELLGTRHQGEQYHTQFQLRDFLIAWNPQLVQLLRVSGDKRLPELPEPVLPHQQETACALAPRFLGRVTRSHKTLYRRVSDPKLAHGLHGKHSTDEVETFPELLGYVRLRGTLALSQGCQPTASHTAVHTLLQEVNESEHLGGLSRLQGAGGKGLLDEVIQLGEELFTCPKRDTALAHRLRQIVIQAQETPVRTHGLPLLLRKWRPPTRDSPHQQPIGRIPWQTPNQPG